MEKEKKIPVKISITGTHLLPGESLSKEPEETKEESFGFLSMRGNSVYLVYETKEIEEITINHLIKISPDTKELKKTSTYHKGTITSPASSLIYEEGKSRTGFYSTPYGRLDAKTFTKEMSISESNIRFSCTLTGSMEINNSPVSEFELKIEAVTI